MDPETQQQLRDLAELRDTHEKRLRILLLQAAYTGRQTPPHALLEIGEIQEQITQITATMAKLQIAESRRVEQVALAASVTDLGDISMQISEIGSNLSRELRHLFELSLLHQDVDTVQRRRRQRWTNIFYITITALVIVDILVRVFYH